jgi:2-polyprenyl-3-methyl-5-hydroxy-6-metoxy-1,4-benzoquinol methylase
MKKIITRTLLKVLGHRSFEKLRYIYYKYFVPDLGYDKAYYEGIHSANHKYYNLLAITLMDEFHPKTLIDCGCGHGEISREFIRNGCEEAFLFDGSIHAVEMARQNGMKNVEQLDFTNAEKIPAQGDLAICLEVAEHIPQAYARNLCSLLANAAPTVVFTAAPPGQGGHLHVNTQPQSYWIAIFNSFGMDFDEDAVQRIRKKFNGKMLSDYDVNLMVFTKRN